ncbi:MAG TPA: hypothetical protein VFC19_47855 [Candidatus Limnocylindrales bacterium]|nr:hypothetical protein [Candidatus Limnocylindrales bacterium]
MRSKTRVAAGVIIALLALALAFYLPYGFISEYGAFGEGLAPALSGYGTIAVVAAPVVALGIWLIFRRGLWAVAGALVLSVAAALSGGMFGLSAKEGADQARAAACSADERSELQALGAIETNGEYGYGNSDGSCRGSFGGRTKSSLDELRQVIEGRGWKPGDDEAYTRDDRRLRIEVRDEGEKGLDITVKFDG